MKLKLITAAATAAIILSACGGNAHAATLPDNFVSTESGRIFQLANAVSVTKQGAPLYTIDVRMIDGNSQSFYDKSGAVWAKVVAYMGAAGASKWQAVSGQNRYISTTFQTEISCIVNQGQTVMAWPTIPDPLYLNDGCDFYKAVKARSN